MPVVWKLQRARDFREQKSAIEGRRITIEEVAKAVGLGWSTIQRWETGQIDDPNPESVKRLAEYYGRPITDFFEIVEDDDEMRNKSSATPIFEVALT